MKRSKLFGLICLFFSILASGQTMEKSNPSGLTNGWKTLNRNSYSISYPENWDLDKNGKMGVEFMLTAPQDMFYASVNLAIEDLKGQNISLDQYVETVYGQMSKMVNGKILEIIRLNKNGDEFQKVILTGDHGVHKVNYEMYIFIKNGKAYVLTSCCENKHFDTYKVMGEKIQNSFKLK